MTINVKAVSRSVGQALLVSSLFMLVCVIMSIADGRDSAFVPLLSSFLMTFIVGIFPQIFVRGVQPIAMQDGYVIIVLSWLLSFIFGMLPYVMWGGEMTVIDAWFESVSGFTTTGASVLNNIEALPRSLLLWRSCTHFIGGLGVVVFLLVILPSASPFRLRLSKLEAASLSREGYHLQSVTMVRAILLIYVGIFALATLFLRLAGMPMFDAVNHGLSLCATGGFSIKNNSIAAYGSDIINVVTLIFMVIATTNFILLYTCVVRRSFKPFFKSRIVQSYLISILVLSVIAVISLRFHDNQEWGKAVMNGTATVISYMTTTGFAFCDNSHWPFLACAVLLYASIQCATAGSTSSGIQIDRILVVFKAVRRQVARTLNPDAVSHIRVADVVVDEDKAQQIILYTVLYFIIMIVSTALLLMAGTGVTESLSGAIACLSNVGPGLGDISTAGNYDCLSSFAKFVCTVDMFLGRIEIYPLLIAFSLIYKRNG